MKLKWTEGMWLLYNDKTQSLRKIGEAGNTVYSEKSFVTAMRIGDEVIIDAPTNSECRQWIVPAEVTVDGFYFEKNGKTLRELMEEGVVYNFFLETEWKYRTARAS